MESEDPRPFPDRSQHGYMQRVAIAALAIVILAVLWVGREAMSVIFAGVLFAVFLSGLTDNLSRVTRLSRRVSVAAVLFVLIAAVGGMAVLIAVYAPDMLHRVQQFPIPPQLRAALERLQEQQGLLFGQSAEQLSAGTMRWGGYLLTVFFVGVFVASQPGQYRRGLLALVPHQRRSTAANVLVQVGKSLRYWLLARAVSMIAVGILSAALFLFAGVSGAVPLALLAGLLTFIPYFGPFIALVPVVVVSLGTDTSNFLVATGGYLAVQMLTGFVVDPLLQQRIVDLPAALILTSQILLGVLIGPLGVAIAAPLALAALVLLRCLGVGRNASVQAGAESA